MLTQKFFSDTQNITQRLQEFSMQLNRKLSSAKPLLWTTWSEFCDKAVVGIYRNDSANNLTSVCSCHAFAFKFSQVYTWIFLVPYKKSAKRAFSVRAAKIRTWTFRLWPVRAELEHIFIFFSIEVAVLPYHYDCHCSSTVIIHSSLSTAVRIHNVSRCWC